MRQIERNLASEGKTGRIDPGQHDTTDQASGKSCLEKPCPALLLHIICLSQ
jgi:hypothetical protein